jgi:hypothetical protein
VAAKQVRSRGTVCIAVNVTDGLTFMNSYGIAYRDLCSKARSTIMRLSVVGCSKGYSKALEYKYRVKTAALGTLKRYSILSLTLYLE